MSISVITSCLSQRLMPLFAVIEIYAMIEIYTFGRQVVWLHLYKLPSTSGTDKSFNWPEQAPFLLICTSSVSCIHREPQPWVWTWEGLRGGSTCQTSLSEKKTRRGTFSLSSFQRQQHWTLLFPVQRPTAVLHTHTRHGCEFRYVNCKTDVLLFFFFPTAPETGDS